MNKQELIEEVYCSFNGSFTKKECREVLDRIMGEITKEVSAGQEVRLVNFGTFKPSPRKPTRRVHPQTGEKIKVDSKVIPKFSPGKGFREKVKNNLKAKKDGSGALQVEES